LGLGLEGQGMLFLPIKDAIMGNYRRWAAG